MGTAVLIILFSLSYFVPTFVAGMRNHPQGGSIFVINIFFGWTLVGWVIALAMSVSHINAQTT